MPPKKTAADSAPSSDGAAAKDKKSDAALPRKPAAHPSTVIMVREALNALDSRKGVSSQAIQNFIKEKYPSVDVLKLKHLVRRALKKGIEVGTLVRPANSTVTTGATGKFRLAPKLKDAKTKTENFDPNVRKEAKAAKTGTKKPKKAGDTKKEDAASEQSEAQEDSKPPKKPKKDSEDTTSKAAPAKKPKGKMATVNGDYEGASSKPKEAKATKEAKARGASRSKTAKAVKDAPATKAGGKGGKKTVA